MELEYRMVHRLHGSSQDLSRPLRTANHNKRYTLISSKKDMIKLTQNKYTQKFNPKQQYYQSKLKKT